MRHKTISQKSLRCNMLHLSRHISYICYIINELRHTARYNHWPFFDVESYVLAILYWPGNTPNISLNNLLK